MSTASLGIRKIFTRSAVALFLPFSPCHTFGYGHPPRVRPKSTHLSLCRTHTGPIRKYSLRDRALTTLSVRSGTSDRWLRQTEALMADDKAPQSNTDKRGGNERRWVTMIVLIGSFGGLIVLATLIIISSWIQKPSDDAKKLFDALLPVFGTWVGTLLSFYFSKDNFEAATKSVTEMANKISGAEIG